MEDVYPDHIDFNAKHGDWIAVKRMTITDKTTPQSIAFHLAGIRNSTDLRIYKLLSIKTEILDKLVEEATKGAKKNQESLSASLQYVFKPEAKKAIQEAIPDKGLEPIAITYLLSRIIRGTGYSTAVDQLMLSKIYPELKPPKVRGLKGLVKKKD